MSSTRYKPEDAPMRQERFASSQEFERGLIASMVARRCSVLDDAADRELIWWLHFMSHRDGGLKALVADLLTKHGERLGTVAMRKFGKRSGNYSADQVREIRTGLPKTLRGRFLIKGEINHCILGIGDAEHVCTYEEMFYEEREREITKAKALPSQYAVVDFEKLCQSAAENGLGYECTEKPEGLEDHLRRLCLDPGMALAAAAPWYFAELVPTLRDYMQACIAERKAATVVTSLGQKVCDVLDYTAHAGAMTLIEGNARIGKSFSARAWCEQHPGRARFIEVPTGNDDTGFFRALARGLGLGNFTQYKAGEIRERVESVLLTRDLLLCLDESHRLWPEVNPRYGFPKRINWLMSLANQGVAICLIGTPQFIERQKAVGQSGWNSSQFIGRLGHYEPLPRELSDEDLMAVAKSVLPEADSRTKRALADYALTSAKYLAAIEAIAKRARYIATKDGRTNATTDDVRRAMKESVIPADSKLVSALKAADKPTGRGGRKLPAEVPVTQPPSQALPYREVAPPETSHNRLTGEALELAGKG